MSEANPDLDLGGEAQEEAGKGGKLKLIIILVVAALVLGAGAAWFMMPKDEAVAAEGAEAAQEGEATAEAETAEAPPAPTPLYYDLGQEFISNLSDGGLMRIKVSIMSYEQVAIDKATYNKAAIVHEILSLLRLQSQQNLVTTEGQDKLRMEIKEVIQGIVRQSDSEPGVEEVYLTDFIVQ